MLAFLLGPRGLNARWGPPVRPAVQQFSRRKRFQTASLRSVAYSAPSLNVREKETEGSVHRYLDAGMGVVVLKRGKARLFREGRNPVVYAGAIERCLSPSGRVLRECDPVAVCDGALAVVGYGFFNSRSMFQVRLLRHVDHAEAAEEQSLPWKFEEDIQQRMRDAVSVREAIGLPCPSTNVYRVVNGEGDRLSGLVVDRVDSTLIVSSSALWCETYSDQIVSSLEKALPSCEEVVWRPNIERLRQDGLEDQETAKGEDETSQGGEPRCDPKPSEGETEEELSSTTAVVEAGVKYAISRFALTRGQKTGHYADQRENRAFIRQLVRQSGSCRQVLDLFCYTGGFALNAALGNDNAAVTAVDSSARALEMGRKNASLNGVAGRVEFVQADVMRYLRGAAETRGEAYDLVIVDPPKFAPTAKALGRATHKYRSLNAAAMRMVRRGGLLCTCSCSAAMTQNRGLFVETVRKAAGELGREVTLLKTLGAAADHPVAPEMRESEYLTVCIFACR